ncbi:MAG: hypothetical protein ACI86M_000026 [Saprospiraceae bacterium]|jgi:hypothetical protein
MLDFLKTFFSSQPKLPSKVPFLHEAIDVKNYALSDLLLWQGQGNLERLTIIVERAFSDELITGKSISATTSIMKSSHANGWIIHCGKYDFTDLDYKHFAYLLYKKVNGMGYTLNLAEIRSQERTPNIENITKYYLKPSLRNRFIAEGTNLANQLYGNITIEYKMVNDRPFEFKFTAHAYQDSKYLPPLDFSDLIDKVLG